MKRLVAFVMFGVLVFGGVAEAKTTTTTVAKAPKLPKVDTVIFEQSGTGSLSTDGFVVPTGWKLAWRYDCVGTGFANTGGNYFIVQVSDPAGSAPELKNQRVNELGNSGLGTQVYNFGGRTHLAVIALCPWTVQVIVKKRPAS